MEEDLGAGLGSAAAIGSPALSSAATQMAATGGAAGAFAMPETTFTLWNIASLVMCAVMLMLIGMFTYDLLRNMWSWNGPYSINSSMMDGILSWFEK